ncbi:sodium-dependent transporter [Mobilicoccus pelagius]|uniref:Putative NSS family transporter n=1 Tax=Mobilicoccus pelagius NBRC 104925 TaxID=1089455 RepID=H5USH8_9MICO|nr:sodium-dependent transporter [Mobilicoccus pelagius]GAB48686.1 putative NSS family transporter [Mobilicoccus pelagius NBRC 104925]
MSRSASPTPDPPATGGAAPREQWSGQLGFLLAAIGSAVGLGNIWRFPGVAYENGGGAFLIPYLVALLTAGIPILFLDYALGHRYRGSSPAVFRRLHRGAEALGWFQVLIAFFITVYYAAIIAWAASYVYFSATKAWGPDPVSFLVKDYLQVGDPAVTFDFVPGVLAPLVGVWIVVLVIMAGGVQKGLERANKVFLPLLIVLFLGIVVRGLTLPGAVDGLNAFFTPDFSALAKSSVWIGAYSQIFFSLSIAFGIMLTYSSYLPRRANLGGTGLVAAFANSSFEILAGIGVFAALGFMARAEGTTIDQLEGLTGVGLSFMTFPALINEMPGGEIFGVLFFLSLVLAGLTSIISLLEVVTAAVQEKFDLGRLTAVGAVGGTTSVLSILFFATVNGLNLLDVVDKWVNEIGIVVSAIVMTVVVTYVLRRLGVLQRHLNGISSLPIGAWWRVLVGVVTPVMLVVMLVATVRELLRDGYGEYPAAFTNTFGWGVVALMAVLAFVLAFVPWRTDVDAPSAHDHEDEPAGVAATPVDDAAYEHPHGHHPDVVYHAGTDPEVARPPRLHRRHERHDPQENDR